MKQKRKSIVLVLTHVDTKAVRQLIKQLKKNFVHGDVGVLWHVNQKSQTPDFGVPVYPFTAENLTKLNYKPINSQKPLLGAKSFPLLWFFLEHSHYDYYWLVEFDVRFSGKWKHFFDCFHERHEDLLTSHIRRFRDEPNWSWWNSLQHDQLQVSNDDKLASLNVIFRISNRALKFLNTIRSSGWQGHYEVFLPTMLHNHGFTLLDFGGNGSFVPSGFTNRFYLMLEGKMPNTFLGDFSWTMSCLRSRNFVGFRRNKLYHPVKSSGFIDTVKRSAKAGLKNIRALLVKAS